MNCDSVRELLSHYYDGQLPPETTTAVRKHLQVCFQCAQEVWSFAQLSAIVKALPDPAPPYLWSDLERRLEQAPLAGAGWQSGSRWRPALRTLVLAASLLATMGVGWSISEARHRHDSRSPFSAEISDYLAEFRRSPIAAQATLISTYNGNAVDARRVLQQVGYRPVVLRGLPAGYTVVSTHLLDMPCCRCVQSLCKSRDGSSFAVFEHEAHQTNWFAPRPATETMCNGTQCKLIDLNDRLAANWQVGDRHLTVIGLRDLEEVEMLVARLGEPRA